MRTKYALLGAGASIVLFSIYVGIVSIAQGLRHALQQAGGLWYLIVPLFLGFGLQVALFLYLRDGLKRLKAARASVAVSGTLSGGSMLACCAHHLADVMPVLGISGAAAALASYQKLFLVTGLLSNLVGLAFMLDAIQCAGLPIGRPVSQWNMGLVKKWTIGASLASLALIAAITFL